MSTTSRELAGAAALVAERGGPERPAAPCLALVGNPNVGKSVMFHNLTGRYATVSNYPGTTVEVTGGPAAIGDETFEVVDTPGMYSLVPITDEERVARRILLEREVAVVLHMVDAKNLERMLPLTLQLQELGLPLVLVLNMMDEAERIGITVDADALAAELGVPVVTAVATSRRGLQQVKEAVRALRARHTAGAASAAGGGLRYDEELESAVAAISCALPPALQRAARGLALLLLQQGGEVEEHVRAADPRAAAAVAEIVRRAMRGARRSPTYMIAMRRQDRCRQLVARHVTFPARARRTFADRLSDVAIRPLTGVPILLLVLYLGLYRLVGTFGGGDVVNLLEKRLFGEHINPWINGALARLLPAPAGWQHWARELVGGDYGVATLGLTYAFAIVLPIVSLFFLFFSVLEDSGYFPRLAMLVDRLFKRLGLNGRAVIPLVLGFGCGTMAALVTRIQETRRERVITTFLLALTIPCSAQFGVITGVLAGQRGGAWGVSPAFLIWAVIVVGVFLLAGYFTAKVVPGEPAMFYMELPPLRLPHLGNVLIKTLARMKWYFAEVLPLFVAASLFIWIGRLSGLFAVLLAGLRPLVGLLGLPPATAEVFLYGFFRRDFGAAGLYTLTKGAQLTGVQLLVAGVTLTLFMPCVAQFLVMIKERGWRTASLMAALVFVIAFTVGALLNLALQATGVVL